MTEQLKKKARNKKQEKSSMCNLDISEGIRIGTFLVVTNLYNNVIKAKV